MNYSSQFADFFNGIDWIGVAKVVLGFIMFCLGILCLYVTFSFRGWYDKLEQLEYEANQQSDEAILELSAARARMTILKNRLFAAPEEKPASAELMQHAGKVLMMALVKERSAFQWGMLGLNLARSAWAYWRNK